MALDDLTDLIGNALRTLDRRQRASDDEVAGLRARLDALLEVLQQRDVISEGSRKHVNRFAGATNDRKPRVRLRTVDPDKYAMPHGEPVDCAARMHLCHGRCCTFTVTLSPQDLEEGKVQWELDRPYILRRTRDHRCIYQDADGGHCTNYEVRPATCRAYSCKNDPRIWADFDNRIPASPFDLYDDEA